VNSISVVRFSGELDVARKQELKDALHLDPQERAVLLDLGSVTYADSTALAEILRFSIEVERRGARLAVFIANPQFHMLIRYAGCDQAFKIFHNRGDALTYLGESP